MKIAKIVALVCLGVLLGGTAIGWVVQHAEQIVIQIDMADCPSYQHPNP